MRDTREENFPTIINAPGFRQTSRIPYVLQLLVERSHHWNLSCSIYRKPVVNLVVTLLFVVAESTHSIPAVGWQFDRYRSADPTNCELSTSSRSDCQS